MLAHEEKDGERKFSIFLCIRDRHGILKMQMFLSFNRIVDLDWSKFVYKHDCSIVFLRNTHIAFFKLKRARLRFQKRSCDSIFSGVF